MNKSILWIIIIFICAATFRLTNLDLIEFKLDEARDVYEMERFYAEPYFIQRGTIQSTGVYNPPLWYYFLVFISLPSRDPQYLSFMIALLNCVAVAGFYWVVQRFYGQWVGVVSGLLLAFSPWLILFSRKIWAPDMIVPLLVPLFYSLHKKNAFWITLLLSLLAQLHASGLFLAAAIIPLRINLKFAFFGLLVSILPLLPYIAFQFQNGCPDCSAFSTYQQGEAITATPFFDGKVFLRPFQLVNGAFWSEVLGEEGYRDFVGQYPFITVITFITIIEFMLLPIGVWFVAAKRKEFLLLPGLLLVVPLLLFLTRTPAHLYYFLILSPIVMVLYSLGVASLRRGISITIITVLIIMNIIFMASFYKFLSDNRVVRGEYGATYGVVKALADEQLAGRRDDPNYNLIRAEFWVRFFGPNAFN